MGYLGLFRFEMRAGFTTEEEMPFWIRNALQSGFGARLREMVCVRLST